MTDAAVPAPRRPALTLDADVARLLVGSVRDYAIFVLDPEGFIASWNPGAQRIKGWTADEIVGQHFSVFYPQEARDRDWPATELALARRDGSLVDEGWRLRRDGSMFWAHVTITALFDESGELRGFAKVTRDLSERRAVEETLRRSEERFRLLVEGVREYAIFMLDPDGRVASWNAGAEHIKGYTAAEIVGQHFSRFYPVEAIQAGWPDVELETARRTGRFEDEGWRLRKDGSRFWANVVITALHDPDGRLRGFAKVTRDLTDRRMVEGLERHARQTNEFIAMLSHELRNPLAPIRNAASMLLRSDLAPERVAWAAAIIERQTTHLTRLVDDLLDVSRITAGKLVIERAVVDLADVVARAVELVRPLVDQAGQRLVVDAPRGSEVWGDVVRLTQVLGNLLHNATKFTPAGGEIRVAVEQREDACLVVSDTGEGFEPGALPRAFELFTQGPGDFARSRGGLGLGLTIVKRLVELHGGRIQAESEGPGRGSRFTILLPLLSRARGDASVPTAQAG